MGAATLFLNTGRVGFPHVCNPSLARGWAFYLATDRFDPDALVALAPAEQAARVVEFYRGLAACFRALNVRPYGWKFYRSTWERVLGSLDTEQGMWAAGEWDQLFTIAWADSGGNLDELKREGFFLSEDSEGLDQHRVFIRNDGTVATNEAPPFPSSGVVVSSRLGWAVDVGSDPGKRLQIVPSWQAYLTVGRLVAARLYDGTANTVSVSALIVEMRVNVEDKNFATAWGAGIPITDLPGYAELQAREGVANTRADVSRATSTILGIAGALAAIPGAQIAGLVVGLVAAVIELLSRTIGFAVTWQRDVFGRAEPVFEAFRFDDSLSESAATWPEGPPGWVDTEPEGTRRGRLSRPTQSDIAEMGARSRAFYGQPVGALVAASTDLPSLDAPGGTEVRVVVESRDAASLPRSRVWIGGTEIPQARFSETRPARSDGVLEWVASVRLPVGQWRVVCYVPGRIAHVTNLATPDQRELRLNADAWRRAGRYLPVAPPDSSTPPPTPPPTSGGGGGLVVALAVGGGIALAGLVAAASRNRGRNGM